MEKGFIQKMDYKEDLFQPKHFVLITSLLGFCLLTSLGKATDLLLGDPFIKNYPTTVYQAGIQNWAVDQHANGYIFLANNNGLLQFDGSDWRCFPLEKKTIARSLLIQGDSVFVGGQNEFGYFRPDSSGNLIYHSLLDLVSVSYRNFEDVWEIVEHEGSLFFYASNKLYQLHDEQIRVVWEGIGLRFLGAAQGRLFLQSNEGLFEKKGSEFVPIQLPVNSQDDFIFTSVLPTTSGKILFTTLKDGFFTLAGEEMNVRVLPALDNFVKKNRIYCATQDKNGQIILGTSSAGVLVLDQDYQLKTHISRNNGLQKNNVLSLLTDQNDNLWIGLDNGIDYAEINGAYSQIIPDQPLEGTAYTFIEFDGYFYFGTSSGLYALKADAKPKLFDKTSFNLVPGTEGQVWGLAVVANRLLMGHHEGAFEITRKTGIHGSKKLSNSVGTWNFIPLHNDDRKMIAGTYEGLELYELEAQGWEWSHKIEGLTESSRFIVPDGKGNIWMAHPYRGIYKVELNTDLRGMQVMLYGQKQGLASDHLNHVFSINNELLFTSETGIFRYQEANDHFELYREMQELIQEEPNLIRIFEDEHGNIWFVGSNTSGRLKVTDKGVVKRFKKDFYPSLTSQLVRGFEFIHPLAKERIIAGAEKGFITFDPKRAAAQRAPLQVLFQSMYSIADGDSLILAGHYSGKDIYAPLEFDHFRNAFRFSFTAPVYGQHDKVLFQCYLEGSDEDWSSWNSKKSKEYTNLSPGDYVFRIRAKNQNGQESPVVSYHFTISPPWYASNLAKFIYFLLVLATILGLILIPRSRFKKETANLVSEQRKKEEEHQKVVQESERAIIALQNKNLEEEIRHKNQELASTTMHLVQRSEMIHKLRNQLEKLNKDLQEATAKKQVEGLIRLLSQDDELAREWDQFAHHFDQVHSDFLKRLKVQFPQLTSNDQKLCAYLRMNLTTKEIAPLMNISVRGVEVGRYRLRKKLDLDTSVDLNEFMMNL